MRITALHNLREPGLIPNGFQKEDAPAAAPDQAWQPEMRNRAEAMTDTRHVVEFLNPRVHLEINAANRTSVTDRSSLEMGRERENIRSREKAEKSAEFERRIAEYEQLLRFLWEKAKRAGYFNSTARKNGEGQGAGQAARDVPSGMDSMPENRIKTADLSLQQETRQFDYYFHRGVEAYSRMQKEAQVNSVLYEI